ncbi:outer membrane receptor protein involved in Fe transport [Pontibacter aydingkolensis]|uniref:TonB-dependent receptor family protein n=1 Tax=Pontibacter aydingkolensis TaxID=1911536 RepID=A0ABS7CQ15_9BACT|nr:outer membrane beta-barrel family protein [Pontibacter aydingkolensis]MBW7465900.1 TonB-dependent receptor family protein [Pontibacter aydingkolensis]
MKNHLLRILLFAITFTLAYPLSAQQAQPASTRGKISGKLVEVDSKAPVGFANVVLLTAKDSSLVTGATTDIEGVFILERIPAGQFILRASMVGYPTRFIPNINITADKPEANLGNITLSAASTKLAEVQVVAERQLVEFELDKRVVNVSQDINAESGSVAEVMQNLPSVTVDIDGNVSMRGSSNVTILIDGKRSALSNLTLDQIPANLIESIELITNPSSKYNPEGTSGIINLVLKKEKTPGFNGSASVTAGTYDNYNSSLNLNYRYNKWSLTTGYDFRQRTRPGFNNSTTTNFYFDEAGLQDSTSYRLQDGKRNSKDISHSFRFGADYYLTPKHTLSASGIYRFGKDTGNNSIFYRFLDENQRLASTSIRNTDEVEDEKAMDVTLGYRQTFDKKGQELTADFVYNTNIDDEISNFRETEGLEGRLTEVQQTLVDDGNREIIAKADYVHPISENSRFEAGLRTSFERLDDDSRFFDLNNETGQLEYNINQSNHFVFDQHIYSLYSNYSNKYKSVSYQVGARAEQTVTKSDQRTQNIKDDNSYFSLFPTVFVTQDINDDNKVQFSYSRRINRPRSRFLNPFVDRSDRFNTRYGNPNLNPEFVNSLELGYLRYWGEASVNATLFYRHTMDEIERFRMPTTVIVDGEAVPGTETTFLNISDNRSYGAELGYNYPATKWWRLNGSVSAFRTQLSTTQGDTELSNAQFSWNSKLTSTMTVWKDLDIQLSGFYRAPTADIQGRMEQMFSTDLAMKKDVLKKNATVSLRVSDVFNTRQFNFLSYGPNFRTESENRRQSRIIYLGFTYRINSDDNNRNRRRDQNDRDSGGDDDDF